MFQTRSLQLEDAPILHRLYTQSTRYFEIIAAPLPLIHDVEHELRTALSDPRRHLEFIEDLGAEEPVGYLDMKFDYPQAGDATINLLLIAEPFQSSGVGSWAALHLEERLQNGGLSRFQRVQRVLAGIYGDNPGAVRFWQRLGYEFAVDARPVLSWYAKTLETSATSIREVVQVRMER